LDKVTSTRLLSELYLPRGIILGLDKL